MSWKDSKENANLTGNSVQSEKVEGVMMLHSSRFLFRLIFSLVLVTPLAHAGSYCYDALKIEADALYLSQAELTKLKPAERPEQRALKKSFDELWKRSKNFAKTYSDRVKFVNQIRVKFEDPGGLQTVYEGRRNVMVISLKRLGREKKKFVESALQMLGENVVSFPLGEGAGHLYTQFRGQVYDSVGSINISKYEATRSERLETLILLSATEAKNLATYILNAENSPDTTIGPFSYAGATKAKGKLNDNRCRVGGHNCTSWLALAPVGENQQSLMKLIEIPANTEWGTNPGYWSAGLMTRSNEQRTPFVIMWTNDSLENFASRLVNSRGEMMWDFSAH